MMLTFWACRSQSATLLSAAACGGHDTQGSARRSTRVFMAGLCHGNPPRWLVDFASSTPHVTTTIGDPLAAFIEAACVPLDAGHASGTLERADEILAAHPGVA